MWVNSIAIIVLCIVLLHQSRLIKDLHERFQSVQDRQLKMQAADIELKQRTLDLADAHYGLERSYKLLRDTTASALNIFEQQILRGAREDLEALDGTLEDGEAEEQSADTGAGAVRN